MRFLLTPSLKANLNSHEDAFLATKILVLSSPASTDIYLVHLHNMRFLLPPSLKTNLNSYEDAYLTTKILVSLILESTNIYPTNLQNVHFLSPTSNLLKTISNSQP